MRILTRIITFSFIGSLLLLSGCDSLNLSPKDEFQADQVFEDPALTRSYLNELYTQTGLGYGDPMPTPGIVDEALNTHDHPGSQNIMSSLTPGIAANGIRRVIGPPTVLRTRPTTGAVCILRFGI